jgi:hypothetical protein
MKNKKGVSIMVGYVLLITIAITMSIIVYQWLKSYVPDQKQECPDGVSLKINDIDCNKTGAKITLNISMENNGRFNFAGYYISITDGPEQLIATKDISAKLNKTFGGVILGQSIKFSPLGENSFETTMQATHIFNLDKEIYLIEITPTRFEKLESSVAYTACSKARIKQKITCK